jgi:hypothetical protein
MHEHYGREDAATMDTDHPADPYDVLLRAGMCRRCGYPTRERAEAPAPAPVRSPFVRRALAGELPAAELSR